MLNCVYLFGHDFLATSLSENLSHTSSLVEFLKMVIKFTYKHMVMSSYTINVNI